MSHDQSLKLKISLALAESMDALGDLPVTVPLRRVGPEPDESSVDLLIKNEATKRSGGKAETKAETKAGRSETTSETKAPVAAAADGSGTSIRKTFDDYMRETAHRRPRGQAQIVNTLERLMKSAGLTYDSPVRSIVKAQCVAFKNALLADSLKVASVNRMLMLLNHWLKWCRNNDHIDTVPTEGLKLSARAHRATSIKKEAFSDGDMRTILTHPHLTKRKDGRWRETYYCAMLTACTGARAGEVSQLYVEDIRCEGGVDYMDINDAHGKFVKNSSSIRRVPLHADFMRVTGFMDYVAEMRQKKETLQGRKVLVRPTEGGLRLFPHISSKNSTLMTMFFTRLLKRHCGIVTKTKTQHSFRRWWAVALAKSNCNPAIRHRLLGHGQGQGVAELVYLSDLEFSLKELSAAVHAVKIPGLS